jgi:hypothetical protein
LWWRITKSVMTLTAAPAKSDHKIINIPADRSWRSGEAMCFGIHAMRSEESSVTLEGG